MALTPILLSFILQRSTWQAELRKALPRRLKWPPLPVCCRRRSANCRVEQSGPEPASRVGGYRLFGAEGINLQMWFDAVVHYDLSWNPPVMNSAKGWWIAGWTAVASRQDSHLLRVPITEIDGVVTDVLLKSTRPSALTGNFVRLPGQQ